MNRPILKERSTWWRRWIVAPVLDQLSLGISPNKLAWSISFGVVLGVFPVMGTTTVLCLFVGWIFRLNQPLIQVFKSLVYPLHLSLILVFIHAGERLYGVACITYSLSELLNRFRMDPLQFCMDFGMAALHGISAWILVAPFAVLIIRWITVPILRHIPIVVRERKEVAG